MTVEIFHSQEALSLRAADVLTETVRLNPSAHLCLATGASPLAVYREVALRVASGSAEFGQTHITKLDEWLGIPMAHPGTCETFLRNEVLEPWHAPLDRYLSFDSDASDPTKECLRIEQALTQLSSFDLCVLGIGPNGHLGLNEPAEELPIRPHVAVLASSTRRHPMLGENELERGVTMGLGAIMSSRRILILVVGESKSDAWNRLQKPAVTTRLPASFLHLHPDVICLSTVPFVE